MNKTDRHDKTKILLKVALNTINQTKLNQFHQHIQYFDFFLGVGFIDNIKLETARLGSDGGEVASWIEQCSCPEGYVGQFCESCAAGYKRDPVNGGPFSRCVPCECFGHSGSCEPNTGKAK